MEHLQIVRAEVTTAEPLPPSGRRSCSSGWHGDRPSSHADDKGGSGDHRRRGRADWQHVYDGSIATQLAKMRQRLERA